MIVGALTALALLAGDAPEDVKPSQPTEAELVAELVRTRSGAVVLHQYRHSTSDGDGNLVCGVAEIGGRAEPFVVAAVLGRTFTHAPEDVRRVNRVQGPDRWHLFVFAPGGTDRHGRPSNDNANAMNRKAVLDSCPGLSPPPGVVWDAAPQPG